MDYIKKYVRGKSFILDSEAVGFDRKTKEYKPFQSVSQRIRRKYDIDKLVEQLPVEINVFDILYYSGKPQLNEPFKKRFSKKERNNGEKKESWKNERVCHTISSVFRDKRFKYQPENQKNP